MKKFLSYILIAVVIATNLFAPFSVGYKNNTISVNKNIASAEYNFTLGITPTVTEKTINISVLPDNLSDIEAKALDDNENLSTVYFYIKANLLLENKTVESAPEQKIINVNDKINFSFSDLKSATPYKTEIIVSMAPVTVKTGKDIDEQIGTKEVIKNIPIETPTLSPGSTPTELEETKVEATGEGVKEADPQTDGLLHCSIGNLKGCIGALVYYLFFKPTSIVFGLAGKILDFGLMYSISDTSYRSPFVTEGWGIVRDFCNMFFIFVLLYIAFKTILGMGGAKTKEMIGNVVVVGLLINFSLFATQIIIDASNVLTRVFYNQKTIVMGTQTEKDEKGNDVVVSELGDFGEIRLSEAIVSFVDPQRLILEGDKIQNIPVKGALQDEENSNKTSNGMSLGTFIIIILLSSIVNIAGTIAFLTCAFAFIGRVIGLWIAMILSPIVFFSYTVPELSALPMIGHKKWWPETIKLAFMAPIFAFFMYIIVNFMDKGLGLVSTSLSASALNNSLTFLVSILVPYIFIIILLMKAKSIAVSMSGTAGEIISKVGSTIGGVALGAATGGAAMAMRGTAGRLGNKIATSEWATKKANSDNKFSRFIGNTTMKAGKAVGSGSFDIRNTDAGKNATKFMGVSAGKGKTGGYAKYFSDKVERKTKNAKELEVGDTDPLKQSLNQTEGDLQKLLEENKAELDRLDAEITSKRQAMSDASIIYGPKDPETKKAAAALQSAKDKKKALKDGANYVGDWEYNATNRKLERTTNNTKDYSERKYNAGVRDILDDNGNVIDHKTRTISYLENQEIKEKKIAIEDENRTRGWKYANKLSARGGKANRIASHKIRMSRKLDSGNKDK